MPLPNLLALAVLFIGVPLNAIVTVMLLRRARANPTIKVLHERMVVSAVVLLLLVVFGLIFLNNDTLPPPFNTDLTKLITRFAMLVIALVPPGYWLWLYLFDGDADAP
jgi:hypothetical protein